MFPHHHRSYASRIGVGAFLILVGALLLIGRFAYIPIPNPWHLWPLIMIVICLAKLIDAEYGWEYRKAVWWLFFGSWLLISELQLFGLSFHNSWPILLVGIGISMVWKSTYHDHDWHYRKEESHENEQ